MWRPCDLVVGYFLASGYLIWPCEANRSFFSWDFGSRLAIGGDSSLAVMPIAVTSTSRKKLEAAPGLGLIGAKGGLARPIPQVVGWSLVRQATGSTINGLPCRPLA